MKTADALSRVRQVCFALADVERLAFPDGRFDRVVSRRAFHHFPDPARVLAETARVWGRPSAMDDAVKRRVDALWKDLGLG